MTRIREAPGLTFDDVLLVPRHATVHPRDVSTATLFTRSIPLNIPLISAAMVQPRIIEERLAMLSAETHKVAIERALRFVQRSVSAPHRRPPA